MASSAFTVTQRDVALAGYFRSLLFKSSTEYRDLEQYFVALKPYLLNAIIDQMQNGSSVKVQLRICINFYKNLDNDATITAYFNNRQLPVFQATNLNGLVYEILSDIEQKVHEFQERGSGWVIDGIVNCVLHIAHYRPIHGRSYIELPRTLRLKKAIINVKNWDNKCFLWAILSAIYPVEQNAHRVSNYEKYVPYLKTDGIEFPVAMEDIGKFELLNNMSISVFGYGDENQTSLNVLRLPKSINRSRHINLLHLSNAEQSHYCWIKDLNRLLYNSNRHKTRKYHCRKCLKAFYAETDLTTHEDLCFSDELQIYRMPENGGKVVFRNHSRKLWAPLVVYADMECILKPVQGCQPSTSKAYTQVKHIHIASGVGSMIVRQCCDKTSKVLEPISIDDGENCVSNFIHRMIRQAQLHAQRIRKRKMTLMMTAINERELAHATSCHICKELLKGDVVRDHCHCCGSFRGAAHNLCNLKLQRSAEMIVVFHNLRRYDGHLIMQAIGQIAHKNNLELDCIPRGIEDYISFSLKGQNFRIRFIDSYQFLSASLDTLVKNLQTKGESSFKATISCEPNRYRLLLRKGVYPYEYMNDFKKLSETQLPPIEQFYSSLTMSQISTEDYEYAQNVWKEFNLTTMKEYHDLYLRTDVALLADVFENFRDFGRQHYELDPCHYPTLPSYGWDACLLKSHAEIDLLTDPDMYSFFEMGIRGGTSMITKRYARANNRRMTNFDKSAAENYIMYWDMNNLYGYTMSFKLPVGDFNWVPENELSSICVSDIADDADYGYVFEVDLEYPSELHDLHNDFPVAPERLKISVEMLEEKQKPNQPIWSEKLTPNLFNKEAYVVHYRTLKYYIDLGLKLKRIRRAVRFRQTAWMAEYINFNTEMRKRALSDFEKDLFKLLNNSVFGKSMENVRKYITLRLITSTEMAEKLTASPLFDSATIFNDNLVAVKMKQSSVWLSKPIFTGFVVLDLSKLLMYKFHYDFVQPQFGMSAQLLFTDTDSLCYQIYFDGDLYEWLIQHSELFDLSNYPMGHVLHCDKNKKVMGKMKDEAAGHVITEFVGLRPKMYSLLVDNMVEKKRAKGVTRAVMRAEIRHKDYVDVLRNSTITRHRMMFIRSSRHEIQTLEVNKIGLSANDSKTYIRDTVNTFAHGHYRTLSA